LKKKPFLAARYDHVSHKLNAHPLGGLCARAFLLSEVHRDSLIALAKYGIGGLPESCFIVASPFIKIKVDCMIIAQGGRETAAIRFNYEDAQRQFDATNKVWMFHYTVWMNTAIYLPRKIMILRNVRCRGYLSGMDTSFFTRQDDFNPQKLSDNKASKFVFSNGANFTRDYAKKNANPLSLFGAIKREHVPYDLSSTVANAIDQTRSPQWPSFHYYNNKWGLSSIITNREDPESYVYSSLKDKTPFSGLMFDGKIKLYDPVTKHFSKMGCGMGSGHLAKFDEPGMRGTLSGDVQIISNRWGTTKV